MSLNSDFDQSVVITPDDQSPPLVPLDQDGQWETSFLTLLPNESLSAGKDSLSEEIIVLSGQLSTDQVLYPTRTFLRIPAEALSSLAAGPEGARIFRKKGHIATNDQRLVAIETAEAAWHQGQVPGLTVMPLHSHIQESMALVRWAPNTRFNPHIHPGGEEIIVLEGTFHDEHGSYPTGTWIRNRPYSKHTPFTTEDGALIYVKTGHLPPLSSL